MKVKVEHFVIIVIIVLLVLLVLLVLFNNNCQKQVTVEKFGLSTTNYIQNKTSQAVNIVCQVNTGLPASHYYRQFGVSTISKNNDVYQNARIGAAQVYANLQLYSLNGNNYWYLCYGGGYNKISNNVNATTNVQLNATGPWQNGTSPARYIVIFDNDAKNTNVKPLMIYIDGYGSLYIPPGNMFGGVAGLIDFFNDATYVGLTPGTSTTPGFIGNSLGLFSNNATSSLAPTYKFGITTLGGRVCISRNIPAGAYLQKDTTFGVYAVTQDDILYLNNSGVPYPINDNTGKIEYWWYASNASNDVLSDTVTIQNNSNNLVSPISYTDISGTNNNGAIGANSSWTALHPPGGLTLPDRYVLKSSNGTQYESNVLQTLSTAVFDNPVVGSSSIIKL
jgi:hypothetical protein